MQLLQYTWSYDRCHDSITLKNAACIQLSFEFPIRRKYFFQLLNYSQTSLYRHWI